MMITQFCSAMGITKNTVADWLGVSRFVITRISKKNSGGKNNQQQILEAFIGEWLKLEKEAIIPPEEDYKRKAIQLEWKRLELEKQRINRQQAIQKAAETQILLSRRLAWLNRVRVLPLFQNLPGIYNRLEDYATQTRKKYMEINGQGQEFDEMDLRHLNEKILLLQQLENKAKNKIL